MSGKTLALIGGTGLNKLGSAIEVVKLETPFGAPSAPIHVIREGEVRLLFLARHGIPHRFPPHAVKYRANIWALKEAGADHILAVSAVGGIAPHCSPGSLHALDQVIDYTWGREQSFSLTESDDLQHVDFSYPYEGQLRELLLEAADKKPIPITDGGCVGVFQGPRLESAAEVERARRDGCTVAGMTAMPEAALARELGLDYAGVGVVSNWAAGVRPERISEDDIAETLREPMGLVRNLIDEVAKLLSAS